MRFNRRHLPKTRSDLDRFVREYGLSPVGVTSYKNRDIFVAETELETDRPYEYDWGYFQTAWFVNSCDAEEQFEVGSWIEFDAMHDSDEGWTPKAKRMARINSAMSAAKDYINKSEETV